MFGPLGVNIVCTLIRSHAWVKKGGPLVSVVEKDLET